MGSRMVVRVVVGLVVALGVFVLLAPLDCAPAIEILETGPGITVDSPAAGQVECTRILLPDYRGAAEPARWPAAIGAVVLGVLAASAIPRGQRAAPPPGENAA